MADKVSVKNTELKGKNLAIITSLKAQSDEIADDLIIENESFMKTSTQVVDLVLRRWELGFLHRRQVWLRFRLLLKHILEAN